MGLRILLLAVACIAAGCSTGAHFILPPGTQLEVNGRPVEVDAEGIGVTRPFFWTATHGVDYRLLQSGRPIKEGRLKTQFRVVSIFWPPYAIIYWPMGFRSGQTYDLVHDTFQVSSARAIPEATMEAVR